ncbi:MAG: AbrB/MazE/SpoVT family DNA-binding domain-containing protein [Nitrososphaeraceae archaeon]
MVNYTNEITTIGKASSNYTSLRTVIPMSIVKQWSLKEGDKLDWSWEARNSEMVVVVRKVKAKK